MHASQLCFCEGGEKFHKISKRGDGHYNLRGSRRQLVQGRGVLSHNSEHDSDDAWWLGNVLSGLDVEQSHGDQRPHLSGQHWKAAG